MIMKKDDISTVMSISNDWAELIEYAQTEYVFGDPMDYDLFKKCMKSTFEYFLLSKEPKYSFDRFETELYGLVRAYSYIPAITDNENRVTFEASTHAAGILAYAILHSEVVKIEGYKLIDDGFLVDGKFRDITYDFEIGDMHDYIELVKIGYWD